MCFTPCLNIISWKISPPVLPMNLCYTVSFPARFQQTENGGGYNWRRGATYDSSISGPVER